MLFNRTFSILFFVLLGLDQITKYVSENSLSMIKPLILIPKMVSFQLVHNYGAAYGILQNQKMLLLGISLLVLVLGFAFQKKIGTSLYAKVGLTFLLAGTAGNFLDRWLRGYVVDFVDIKIFQVFNLADVAIDIGVICFVIDLFLSREKQST